MSGKQDFCNAKHPLALQKSCAICRVAFTAERVSALYCSDACRQEAHRRRQSVKAWKCVRCGMVHRIQNPLEVVCCGHDPQVLELIWERQS